MTVWGVFLNDQIGDCGVAACCNAITLWGGDVTDDDAKIADDRFSARDYAAKVLWGWWWRGIGGDKLGGFATIKKSQIKSAITRFSCAYVALNWPGVGNHAVLAVWIDDGVTFVTWGHEITVTHADFDAWLLESYAIAPQFHPIFMWWALTNNPRWLLFAAPLWWRQ